jgi:hypothetical protein
VYTRKGQKHIRLRISGEGRVRLSAPASTTVRELEQALESKRQWLSKHLGRIRSRFAELDPLVGVMLHGTMLSVRYVPARRKTGAVELLPREGAAELRGPELPREEWLRLLGRRLRREAEQSLPDLAKSISREADIPYGRLFLRNQRTRWGSSSSLGNISLNWRTVMLPPLVQRYLILHELVHQEHLNHSRSFWGTLERLCPRYREAERWLKANTGLIALFRD